MDRPFAVKPHDEDADLPPYDVDENLEDVIVKQECCLFEHVVPQQAPASPLSAVHAVP